MNFCNFSLIFLYETSYEFEVLIEISLDINILVNKPFGTEKYKRKKKMLKEYDFLLFGLTVKNIKEN